VEWEILQIRTNLLKRPNNGSLLIERMAQPAQTSIFMITKQYTPPIRNHIFTTLMPFYLRKPGDIIPYQHPVPKSP